MDFDQSYTAVWAGMMLVLVGSSLVARRLPVSTMVKYGLAWAVIFAGVYGVTLFRGELGEIWTRAKVDLTGDAEPQTTGSATIVHRQSDGHFWVDGMVGGKAVRFLIDSGATTTAISAETAARLGISVDRSRPPHEVMTANGMIESYAATMGPMQIGSISTPALDVLVTDVAESEDLLGMNWLNGLGGWRVEGATMTLTPTQ